MIRHSTTSNSTRVHHHVGGLIALPNSILRCSFESNRTVVELRNCYKNTAKSFRSAKRSGSIYGFFVRHNFVTLYTISTLTIDVEDEVCSVGTCDCGFVFCCKSSDAKCGNHHCENEDSCHNDCDFSHNVVFHVVFPFNVPQ